MVLVCYNYLFAPQNSFTGSSPAQREVPENPNVLPACCSDITHGSRPLGRQRAQSWESLGTCSNLLPLPCSVTWSTLFSCASPAGFASNRLPPWVLPSPLDSFAIFVQILPLPFSK